MSISAFQQGNVNLIDHLPFSFKNGLNIDIIDYVEIDYVEHSKTGKGKEFLNNHQSYKSFIRNVPLSLSLCTITHSAITVYAGCCLCHRDANVPLSPDL